MALLKTARLWALVLLPGFSFGHLAVLAQQDPAVPAFNRLQPAPLASLPPIPPRWVCPACRPR